MRWPANELGRPDDYISMDVKGFDSDFRDSRSFKKKTGLAVWGRKFYQSHYPKPFDELDEELKQKVLEAEGETLVNMTYFDKLMKVQRDVNLEKREMRKKRKALLKAQREHDQEHKRKQKSLQIMIKQQTKEEALRKRDARLVETYLARNYGDAFSLVGAPPQDEFPKVLALARKHYKIRLFGSAAGWSLAVIGGSLVLEPTVALTSAAVIGGPFLLSFADNLYTIITGKTFHLVL